MPEFDPKTLAEQTRQLEEQRRVLVEAARTRDNYNRVLLETQRISGKGTNVSKALSDVYSNLSKRQLKFKEGMNKTYDAIKKNAKAMSDAKEKIKSLVGEQKHYKKTSHTYRHINQRIEEQKKLMDDLKGKFGPLQGEMEDYRKGYKQTEKSIGEINSAMNVFSQTSEKSVKSLEDVDSVVDAQVDTYGKLVDAQKKSGQISEEEAKRLKEQYNTEENRFKLRGKIIKSKFPKELAEYALKIEERAKKEGRAPEEIAREEMRGALGGIVGGVGGLGKGFKGGIDVKSMYAGNKKALQAMDKSFKKFTVLKDYLKSSGEAAGGAAGMMKMLGGALKALGKLGWIGLIITAVQTVAKGVNKLDKFIKKYNKTFAKLYGPTLGLKNVSGAMDEFKRSLFDVQRNIKYGIGSEQITALFDAMAAGGLGLAGVGKRVAGGYTRVIVEAAEQSRDLGITMQEVGGMMQHQMLDMKSGIDEVSDTLKNMAYDAQIAGVQTKKMYEAALSAANALTYYGNYLDEATELLKNFQEQGAMGFKDAQEQTQKMMQSIEGMDIRKRMEKIHLAGIENVRAMFQEYYEEQKTAFDEQAKLVADAEKQLEAAEGRGDEAAVSRIEKRLGTLRDGLNKMRKPMDEAQRAAQGDLRTMAQYLGLLSDRVPEIIMKMVEGRKELEGGLFDPKNLMTISQVAEGLLDETGVRKFMDTLMHGAKVLETENERIAKSFASLFTKEMEDEREGISKILQPFLTGKQTDLNQLTAHLEKYSKVLPVSIERFAKEFAENPRLVAEILEKGKKATAEEVRKMAKAKIAAPLEMDFKETGKERDKRLSELVKQTTPISEFAKIMGEAATFMAANNDLTKMAQQAAIGTLMNTGKIFGFMQRKWGSKKDTRYETEKEFKESDDWRKLITVTSKEAELMAQIEKLESEGKEQNKDEIAVLRANLDSVKGMKKELIGGFKDTEETAERVGKKQAKEFLAAKEKLEDLKSLSSRGTEEEKEMKRLEDLVGRYVDKYGALIAEQQKKSAGKYAQSMGVMSGAGATIGMVRDYRALTEGWVKVKAGDHVVDSESLSKGISGNEGRFAKDVVNKIGAAGGKDGGAIVTVPITLNVGSVNGDVDDMMKKISPAIKQTFERMYFDKQKRV